MPNWLRTASKGLRQREPEAPEPFELRCVCGAALKGERRAQHQELVCPSCAERLFALPCDVYPRLRAPVPPRPKTAESPAGPKSKRARRPPDRPIEEPAVVVKGDKLRKRRRFQPSKLVTPFRLVILAVMLVIGGTVYWAIRSRSMTQASAALNLAEEQGIAALAAGDFETAAREFQTASDALDVIGRSDPHAGWVRQMQRETTAASRLSPDSLYEIILRAEEQRGAVRAWTDYFRSTYAGDWMIFETTLAFSGTQGKFSIHYPFAIDGTPVQVEADLTNLALPSADGPREVIFAAQLQGCRLDRATQQKWVIELAAGSAFLWSDLNNYRLLGFRADDLHSAEHTARLLSRQTEMLGIERSTSAGEAQGGESG